MLPLELSLELVPLDLEKSDVLIELGIIVRSSKSLKDQVPRLVVAWRFRYLVREGLLSLLGILDLLSE